MIHLTMWTESLQVKFKELERISSGNLLIIMSQIIVAIQMVTEQKFLMEFDVPPLLG